MAKLDNKNQDEAKERCNNNDKTSNTSDGNKELDEADYSTFMEQEEYNIYKNMINENNLDDGFNIEDLSKTNKVVKALRELLDVLGEDYEDTQELRDYINEIGIYKVDPDVITLQEAVNHSRMRVNHIGGKIQKHDELIERIIKVFLSSTYNMSEIGIIFHPLNFPQDYQWLNNDQYKICNDYGDCYSIGVGAHESDYTEIYLQDHETWPLYDVNNVDIDVECEVNFQQLLQEFKENIGVGRKSLDYIDAGLRIPYSQLSKASSYEIRLIDFLRQLNYTPRVTVCIFKNNDPRIDRATFFLTYIPIYKYSEE